MRLSNLLLFEIFLNVLMLIFTTWFVVDIFSYLQGESLFNWLSFNVFMVAHIYYMFHNINRLSIIVKMFNEDVESE